MASLKLYSTRLDAGLGPMWYKIKTFKTEQATNDFLEENKDFGFIHELKTYDGNPLYAVARNDDKGTAVLKIKFEYEDSGFCQRYYRAECGRLFVVVDGQLHTCNDDDWREARSPVNEDLFEIIE